MQEARDTCAPTSERAFVGHCEMKIQASPAEVGYRK